MDTSIMTGIDIGVENIKVVVTREGKILGKAKGRSGGAKRLENTKAVYKEALEQAGIGVDEPAKVFVTGKGKFDLQPMADDILTEHVVAVKAARWYCPDATCVVQVGADETLVATIKPEGAIEHMVINEKCAAGIGSFIRNMARRLELSREEMNAAPLLAEGGIRINDGCIVFGELDVLNLLNKGVPPIEIASAVMASAAVRTCATINDITFPRRDKVVLLGGLTQNPAFVRALKARSGIDFIIPEEAEYAAAVGCALFAAGWGYNPFNYKGPMEQ